MPNTYLWGWVWSAGIHVSVSPAYFAMMFAWASGIISPCKVICVYGTLRRNMGCKHVADHHILRGSSIHLQLDMNCLFSRDCKPRAKVKDQQIWSILSIPRWYTQGWLGSEGGETPCHEIIILGWWQTKRKGKGKESWVYNHFTGCTRMTRVLGSGLGLALAVRYSDRPCFISVPVWKLGYNPSLKKPQTF